MGNFVQFTIIRESVRAHNISVVPTSGVLL